jgi:RNA 3'-terminal phosphate cyclase (ATP)
MINIDGSMMEGGGQLLRMATSYSVILGDSIRVYNIRAKRRDPGLKPQHLTTLQAAATISNAETKGVNNGSSEIIFKPKLIRGGNYSLDIGTAGSITLLLQCLTPILLFSEKSSKISIKGGTAVNWSPSTPFLENIIYKAYAPIGASIKINVEKHGFYPRGGGQVKQLIDPIKVFQPIDLLKPEIKKIKGVSICGALPSHVAIRQANSAKKTLKEHGYKTLIKPVVAEPTPLSPGSLICLWAEGKNVYLGADSLGARGKPAEVVGKEAADKLIQEIGSGAHLDQHTTDHMILPLSLAEGESVIKSSLITLHTLTAIEIAKIFTGAKFQVIGNMGETGIIKVKGIGFQNTG